MENTTKAAINWKVYSAMAVSVFFWGFSFVWSKQALSFYPPITVIYFRLIVSVVLLFTIGKIFRKLQKVKIADLKNILLIAFFEPFLYFIGENFGLTRVSSTVASVLIATIPLFSPIATFFFFKERVSWQNFVGILLSIVGVIMVLLTDDFSLDADFIGILFMFLAVFSALGYSLVVLRVASKYSVYTIISYQNLMGVILFTPVFFIFEFKDVQNIGLQTEAIVPILQLGIFASTIAFMFFTYGIKHLGVIKANTLSNAIPIVTAMLSFFMLGEKLNSYNFIGIFIVVSGLALSQMKRQKINLRRFKRG